VLYHLLFPLRNSVSLFNLFGYPTFRGMAAFLFAFVFVLYFMPRFIRRLQSRGVKGQPIREDGPKDHNVKRGTPTMGGFVVIAGIFVVSLLCGRFDNPLVVWTLIVMLEYGALGFVDDWRKITQQNSAGVSERGKLLIQAEIAFCAVIGLWFVDFPSYLAIPMVNPEKFALELGIIGFAAFSMLVVVGTSNAVNLTDGLDGLAIGPTITVAATYAVFAYLTGTAEFSHLGLPQISGAEELAVILAAMMGAGLGFLWFNTYPAQVFMGDLGALGLGGTLGFVAVLVKHEIVLVVAGGIFVIEAVSVLMQRYYYKLTKKRIFRMAPIHHHFELLGWPEPKIIVRFWIVSVVLALISLTTLKVR
jgi:phospho-N-acetylmuramoyl-pentapeptide-transferase